MKLQPRNNTPYQQLKSSKLGTIVRENKIVTGLATAATGVVLAGGAAQSQAFAQVAQYGIAPAVGVGVATVSALMAHDAVVNDFSERPLLGAAKLATGVVGTLGGAQVVGLAYDIPGLDRALSTPLGKVFENGQAVLGAGVVGGGLAAGKFALDKFSKAAEVSEYRSRNLALGAVATATSATALLGGAELIGRNFEVPVMDQALTGTVRALSSGGVGSVLGGTLLAAGAAQLGNEAIANFRKGGNDLITVAEGMGAVSAGLGGIQLAGHGFGLKATEGLLTEHAPLVASAALSGLGLAATRTSLNSIKQSGLKPLNSLGMAAGVAMIPGGLAAASASLGWNQAAETLGRGAGALAGLGLGVSSYALGRRAFEEGQQGKLINAAGYGLGATASATASLAVVGESLNVPVLKQASRKILSSTLEPLMDHVLEPSARFLFNHPVAGGAALAVGVGGYLYARYRASKSDQ
ncbi:hypothetical protein IV102_00655 [bacterium]|nr:hypothetical protein [bacterium]